MPEQLEIALLLQSGLATIKEDVKMEKENTLYENHRADARYKGPLDVAPTLTVNYGTGGNNTSFVKSYCIASNSIHRKDENGCNGKGFSDDITYTLTQSDIHAVLNGEMYQNKVGSLLSRDFKGVSKCYIEQEKCIINTFVENSFAGYRQGDFGTLTKSGGSLGGGSETLAIESNLVRRLTPLECERLMGFPDGWTLVNNASDTARYKALGNSIVVPCLDFIFNRLIECEKLKH